MTIDTSLIKASESQLLRLKSFFPLSSDGRFSIRYSFDPISSQGKKKSSPYPQISESEAEFISSVFSRLEDSLPINAEFEPDIITGLRFSAVNQFPGAKNLLGTTAVLLEPLSTSSADINNETSHIWIKVKLNGDQRVSKVERSSIVHEIGHALGLVHAGNRPNSPAYTDDDTIMSYRSGTNGISVWFSPTDLQALREIWTIS